MNVTLTTLGPNCHKVVIGSLTIGFSYTTPVMFHHPDVGNDYYSENVWSNATGKHLNMLGGRDEPRHPHDEFEFQLQSILNRLEIRRGVYK